MKDNTYPGAYGTKAPSKVGKLGKLLAETPIGYKGKFKGVLEDMQANILRHHHKRHSICMFLNFNDSNLALTWITKLNITSAKEQFDRYLNDGQELVSCFYLTSKGYERLGLEHVGPFSKDHKAFVDGIDGRVYLPIEKDFKDPKLYPHDDKLGYLDIHAMLFLAGDDITELNNEVSLHAASVSPFANYTLQSGKMHFNSAGKAVDWFGYRDGISQPKFFPDASPKKQATYQSNDLSPLRTVVVRDKGGEMWYSVGSFLAFLKLEEDVAAFDQMVNAVAVAIDPIKPDRTLAEAYIVGRFKDGTPVTLQNTPSQNSGKDPQNQFDYNSFLIKETKGNKVEYLNDEKGTRCPFHAHIRKANPRSNAVDNQEVRIIARRGVLYEDKVEGQVNQDAPSSNLGMLFMSFQSNIEDQFEHILNRWMLSPNMGGDSPATGVDMFLGTVDGQNLCRWYVPTKWNSSNPNDMALVQLDKACIRFKGGGYFFAPSLSFLKNINKKNMSLSAKVSAIQRNGGVAPGAIRIPPIIMKE